MMDQLRFDGRVAIVTGAGRGLGREYALALAARGAKVVVNNRVRVAGEDPAGDVVERITAAGGEAVVSHQDVGAPEAGDAVVATALESYGRLDIVVANAGILTSDQRPFLDTASYEILEEMMRIHVGGTYCLLRAAWPHLMGQGYGRVVTTGSASGLYGQPGAVEYSAAKGAIMGLTRALAVECAGTGVQINLISPAGFTDANEGLDVDEDTKAYLRTWLDPALVAPAIVWLAHERCPFNGRLFAAGGRHVGRIAIGEAEGLWFPDPTAEDLATHRDEMDSADQLVYHDDAISWGGWRAQLAAKQASPSA
jgi:NAD(P)-dependent dehydrogenase (short-subunit alcohol dehydrogenase family)